MEEEESECDCALFCPGWMIFMGLFVPTAIVTTVWFCYRGYQKMQPIFARQPYLVVLSSSISVIFVILLCFQRLYPCDWPCSVSLWTGYIGVIVYMNVYLIRVFLVYANFNLMAEMVMNRYAEDNRYDLYTMKSASTIPLTNKTHESTNGDIAMDSLSHQNSPSRETLENGVYGSPQPQRSPIPRETSDFWTRHQYVFKKRGFLVKCQMILTFLLLLTPTVVTAYYKDLREHKGDGCLVYWHGAGWILVFYCCVYLVSVIVFSVKLRGKLDAYQIKNELKFFASSVLVGLIPWYILNNYESPNVQNFNAKYGLSTMFLLMFAVLHLASAICYPLYRSYYDPPSLEPEGPETVRDCKKILASHEGFQALEEYLKTEWSVQHLHYWEDVKYLQERIQRYKDDKKGPTRTRLQKVIEREMYLYKTYVSSDAEKLINIGQSMKNQLEAMHRQINEPDYVNVKDSDPECWDRMYAVLKIHLTAQKDVFRMLRDAYRRFKRSDAFKIIEARLLGEVVVAENMRGHGGAIRMTSTGDLTAV